MNKEQCLEMIKLLSAIESWSLSCGKTLPDYIGDRLCDTINELSKEVLK